MQSNYHPPYVEDVEDEDEEGRQPLISPLAGAPQHPASQPSADRQRDKHETDASQGEIERLSRRLRKPRPVSASRPVIQQGSRQYQDEAALYGIPQPASNASRRRPSTRPQSYYAQYAPAGQLPHHASKYYYNAFPPPPAFYPPPNASLGAVPHLMPPMPSVPTSELHDRFGNRPSSAMGYRVSQNSPEAEEWADDERPSRRRSSSVTRDEDADRRRMPPPPVIPPSRHSTTKRRPDSYNAPDRRSTWNPDYYQPRPGDDEWRQYPSFEPPRDPYELSLIHEYDDDDMDSDGELAKPSRRRRAIVPRSSAMMESTYQDALRYQEDVDGPQIPLTAEALRRASRRSEAGSSRSSGSSRYTRSSRFTRSSASHGYQDTIATEVTSNYVDEDDEDIHIKITGDAVLHINGTEIKVHDGGEIILSNARSVEMHDKVNRRSSYYGLEDSRSRTEQKTLPPEPRASTLHSSRKASPKVIAARTSLSPGDKQDATDANDPLHDDNLDSSHIRDTDTQRKVQEAIVDDQVPLQDESIDKFEPAMTGQAFKIQGPGDLASMKQTDAASYDVSKFESHGNSYNVSGNEIVSGNPRDGPTTAGESHHAGWDPEGSHLDEPPFHRHSRGSEIETSADTGIFDSLVQQSMYTHAFTRGMMKLMKQLCGPTDLLDRYFSETMLRSFVRRVHTEISSVTEEEVSFLLNKHIEPLAIAFSSMAIFELFEEGDDTLGSRLEQDDHSAVPEVVTDQVGEFPDVPDFPSFVKKSASYSWLLSMIKRAQQSKTPGSSNAMSDVSKAILDRTLTDLLATTLRSRGVPMTIQSSISVDWDLMAFIRQQEYDLRAEDVLDLAICLTGTANEAYGTTAKDFLEQIWPQTYKPLYGLMKEFLNTETGTCEYRSDDSATLRCSQSDSRLDVYLDGTLDFVLDTIEQLAWLASALRPSIVDEGVVSCTPTVTNIKFLHMQRGAPADDILNMSCNMDFDFEQSNENKGLDTSSLPGFCWTNMFRNPVLVTGYPIPRRTKSNTGLELSLHLMSLLADSKEVVQANESLILKGFCSLLVAVEAANDTVLWHFLFNRSGDRISFFDSRLEGTGRKLNHGLTLRDLETQRHVVGWSGDILEYTGHPQANLAISGSYLPETPSSFVLDKLYVEGGSQVIGGLLGSLGVRDKPVYLRREQSYLGLINWISAKPVVFCDADSQRAWLVDGASALLHLVRASIYQDSRKPAYSLNWQFDGILEGDGSFEGGAAAAIKTLCSFQNRKQLLYMDLKSTENGRMEEVYYTFGQRVDDIAHNLELVIDNQIEIAAKDGYWFRQTGKFANKSITGFDFWDIAKLSGPVRARAYYLPWKTMGHGWIEYIRSIKAMTLFGAKFGDLLQPKSSAELCTGWNAVPTGLNYLGVSVSTLKAIHEARNESSLDRGELTSKILWLSRSELFSQCPCIVSAGGSLATLSMTHIDPIQMLLPKGPKLHLYVSEGHTSISLRNLGDKGAVLFGHTLPLRDRLRSLSSQEDISPGMGSLSFDSRDDSSNAGGSTQSTTTLRSLSTDTRTGSSTTEVTTPSAASTPGVGYAEASTAIDEKSDKGKSKASLWKRLSSRKE